MRKWISGLIATVALIGGLFAIYWQVAQAHVLHFSFLFASAVFAVVCIHWLLEELDLVQGESKLSHEV